MSETEQLFLMAAVWTVAAAIVARFIPNWPGRIAFFAIAVGLPFWELPYGYYNFRKLCDEETALKVIQKFQPQDSICIEYFDLGLYRQLVQAGFTRIEITSRSDNAKEYASNGRVFMTNREQAKSPYCLVFQGNISMSSRIQRSDAVLVRVVDNFPVAKQSDFRWDGTWWQKDTQPILGFGGWCTSSLTAPILALRKGAG
ncbi:MAG: hypothetical protein ABI654_14220 [Betaproteobacteria bacterium]